MGKEHLKIKQLVLQTTNKKKQYLIRGQIKPGNSKILYDAVWIAKEQNTAPIPDEICLGDKIFEGEHIAKAFAKHVNAKVEDIKNHKHVNNSVFQWKKTI